MAGHRIDRFLLAAITRRRTRVHKQHAVAIKYLWSRRDGTFPGLSDLSQTRGTLGIYYALLGHDRFGAVEW